MVAVMEAPQNIEDRIEEPAEINRRRRRTNQTDLAIGYQLDQVIKDFGLECCLIVDDSGHIVGTSPEDPTPFTQTLAALLPSMATLPECRDTHLERLQQHRPDIKNDDLAACLFRAGGRRLYIAALGSEAVMNEVAIFRAILGTRRIHRRG
jgi:hypothetical protein